MGMIPVTRSPATKRRLALRAVVYRRVLGHKDARMTMRYSHLSEAYLRAAVNGVLLGSDRTAPQSTAVGTYMAPTAGDRAKS
jgi:hypothetical protein